MKHDSQGDSFICEKLVRSWDNQNSAIRLVNSASNLTYQLLAFSIIRSGEADQVQIHQAPYKLPIRPYTRGRIQFYQLRSPLAWETTCRSHLSNISWRRRTRDDAILGCPELWRLNSRLSDSWRRFIAVRPLGYISLRGLANQNISIHIITS
jgi:hypothetical protein